MKYFSFSVIFSVVLFVLINGQEETTLFNVQVDRSIDLVSHLPKETILLTFENRGTKNVRHYDYFIEPTTIGDVAYFGATIKGKNNNDQSNLPIRKETAEKTKGIFYRIELFNELRPNQKLTLEIEIVFAHSLEMYPSEITQYEKQYVVYKGNSFFYSSYTTESQKTIVTLPTDRVESFTQTPKPVYKSEQTITYGPYEKISPFSRAEISLHYENNNPFLTVKNLKRWIEVSHWGNIAVEETVEMTHTGATLKGPFSRLDFQRRQDSFSAVKSFKASLPASARDIYYRDEIGNISTSRVKELQDQVEVELQPRYPLFGGWKTFYILGYNVPSYQYLFHKGNEYILKMRLIDHVYDDQLLEDVTIKIVLPEHANHIEFSPPISDSDVQRLSDEKHFTYLDSIGRPVIVLKKRNAVFQHIQEFQIHYTFEKIMLLHEPTLIVLSLFCLFCLVIFLVRWNFSISNNEKSEVQQRVETLWTKFIDNNVKRTTFYQKWEDSLQSLKRTKDLKIFTDQKKKIDQDLKSIQQSLVHLHEEMRAENEEIAEKIAEFQRLDAEQREISRILSGHAEKFVSGKMTKTAFEDQEQTLRTKWREVSSRLTTILNHL